MKKKYLILILCLLLTMLPIDVSAASMNIVCDKMAVEPSTTVNCTVNIFDSEVSGAEGTVSVTNGMIKSVTKNGCGFGDAELDNFTCVNDVQNDSMSVVTYAIEVGASGQTTFSIANAKMVGANFATIPVTVASAVININASAQGDPSGVVDVITVTVPEACTLSTPSGSGESYNVSMMNGQYKNDIGKSRISVFCNTPDSFAIYAVGYSGDTLGNTGMIATTGNEVISTGTATSGNTSNWAMKVESVAGASGGYTPTITSSFSNFVAVPNTYQKIAEVGSVTAGSTVEAAIDTSYAVYIAPNQLSGSYVGKVKYVVVHPASAAPAQP